VSLVLFKVVLNLSPTFANIQTSKLFHLLEVMLLENISTEPLVTLVRELKLTWELKIMLSLCLMLIKKILLMLSLEPVSVPLDKDAWQLLPLFSLENLQTGFQKLSRKLNNFQSVQVGKMLILPQ